MSVSCALLATSLHQWARRYIRLTQPARCSPEKRARKRAFFANGVDKMHIPWAVEGLPTLLHLSLFIFFAGLAIFLFNVDHEVFIFVVWWIGLFSMAYGLITLLPIIRQDSPYDAPLSIPAWFLYAGIQYVTFKVLAFIIGGNTCCDLRDRYRGWMLGGVEKAAEELALEHSSEIDVRILGWTVSALGDDDSLERFFEAIPGLVNSRLVDLEEYFPETLLRTFWGVMDGLIGRTISSNSVTESVKSHRVIICRDVMSVIPCFNSFIHSNLRTPFDQVPASIEGLRVMTRWLTHTSSEVSCTARARAAKSLARIKKRDRHWIAFASRVYGLSKLGIQHYVALGGDNIFLAALISVSYQLIHSEASEKLGFAMSFVQPLTKFEIRDTLPELQHTFCTLWNKCNQEIRIPGTSSIFYNILLLTRHLYKALHQGTDAAPDRFPFCNIASHRPVSTSPISAIRLHHSTSISNAVSRQVKEASIIAEPHTPSDSMAPSEIGDSSRLPVAIGLAYTSPHPADASLPGAVAAALQDIPLAASTATLSYPFEGTKQRGITGIAAECAEPEFGELSIAASTPVTVHTPAPPAPKAPCDASAAPTSNTLLLPPSVVRFFVPIFPPVVQPVSKAASGLHALFRNMDRMTPNRSTGKVILLPRLHARGLVNTGSMCFANAVLQLLVHSPPFWYLFIELADDAADLNRQRGAGSPETCGGATPLADATAKFLNEFIFEKEPSPTQQPLDETADGKPKEDEEDKKDLNSAVSFEPAYLYDAMKEKRRLKELLVRW